MKHITSAVLFVLIIFLTGCYKMDVQGYLVWGGNHTRVYKTLINSKKINTIMEISPSHIIGYFVFDSEMRIYYEHNDEIRRYDFASGESKFICFGRTPLLLEGDETLIFYDYKKGLLKRDLLSGDEKIIIKNSHRYTSSKHRHVSHNPEEIGNYCSISKNIIAIHSKKQNTIVLFDKENDNFSDLKLKDFNLLGFCSVNNSLILMDSNHISYFYHLKDEEFEKLKINGHKLSSTFISAPELKGVFYLKMRFPAFIGQKSDLWFYNLNTKREKRIIKNTSMSNLYYFKHNVL
ncbi:hypothetical protein KAU32_02035 [bacterium]|nr:hypothetical protein [bacterium]